MSIEEHVCPVCGAKADKQILVDWSYHDKQKTDEQGNRYGYDHCPLCESVWLDAMKWWTDSDFSRYIYNEDYGKTDREYDGTRSRNVFPQIRYYIHVLMPECKRVLDYGGGNGVLAELLSESFEASSYDPYNQNDFDLKESDVITAIEVLEHEVNADHLWGEVSQYLTRGGIFIATTELCDGKHIGDWFYANPRAGHDLIYSRAGLEYMAMRHGLKQMFHSGNWHLFRKI